MKLTTEFVTNPVPVTINVNAGSPRAAAAGARLMFAGTALLMLNAALSAAVRLPDVACSL